MQRRHLAAALFCLATFHAGMAPAAAQSAAEVDLTPWAQDLSCAPHVAASDAADDADLRVQGSPDGLPHTLFGTGERLVVRFRGAAPSAGRLFFAQRQPRSRVWARGDQWLSATVQRAGIVRIDEVAGDGAVATVVWACDGIEAGDVLAAYVAPAGPPPPAPAGQPDFAAAGTVLFGGLDRRMGGAPDLLLVSRGEGQSQAVPGGRVSFFRRPFGADGPVYVVGEGTVEATHAGSFLVRIEATRTAVEAGDLVAPQR